MPWNGKHVTPAAVIAVHHAIGLGRAVIAIGLPIIRCLPAPADMIASPASSDTGAAVCTMSMSSRSSSRHSLVTRDAERPRKGVELRLVGPGRRDELAPAVFAQRPRQCCRRNTSGRVQDRHSPFTRHQKGSGSDISYQPSAFSYQLRDFSSQRRLPRCRFQLPRFDGSETAELTAVSYQRPIILRDRCYNRAAQERA